MVIREQEQVGARLRGGDAGLGGPPKWRAETVSSASLIETPANPSRSRSSRVAILFEKAAGLREKCV